MRFKKCVLGGAVFGLLAAGNVMATPAPPSLTANVAVNATVESSCEIVQQPGAVNLSVNPLSATGAASTSFSTQFRCSKGTVATLTLNGGLNGTTTARAMAPNGAAPGAVNLPYTLSETQGGTSFESKTYTAPSISPITLTIYGSIALADIQAATIGSYSDTVVLTLSY